MWTFAEMMLAKYETFLQTSAGLTGRAADGGSGRFIGLGRW